MESEAKSISVVYYNTWPLIFLAIRIGD